MIATHNPGKLAEMRNCWRRMASRRCPPASSASPSPRKPADSFRANAAIKAIAAAKAAQLPAFADDSGLVVDALDGAPGIYSARWAGESKDFMARDDADRAPAAGARRDRARQRKAHFVSALCVAWPDDHLEEVEARVDGTLVWPPRGTAGFGYDPAFLPDGHDAHLRRDDQRSRNTACRRSGSACRTAPAPSSKLAEICLD